MTVAALFDLVAQQPDDVDAHLVYADAVGGLEGELIVLMAQLDATREPVRRAALGAALDALLSKHRTKMLGPDLSKLTNIAWDWKLGFLRSVHYVPGMHGDPVSVVKDVLRLPWARLLRELVVFGHPAFDGKLNQLPRPATLARVEVPFRLGSVAEARRADRARWLSFTPTTAELPPELFELVDLQVLTLHGDDLQRIGPEIGRLTKLQHLDIGRMTNLVALDEAVFGIERLASISMYDCVGLRDRYHMGRVNALLGGFSRAQTPSRRRVVEANLLLGDLSRARAVGEPADLLAALDSNVGAVREHALAALAEALPDPFAASTELGARPRFAVLGKINRARGILEASLAKHGATLAKKLDAKVTHVILGEAPAGQQADLGDRILVHEAHLATLFGTGDVPVAIATPPDELRASLRTRDDVRVAAAIAALQGGVDPALVLELVVVQQDVKLGAKVRDGAKKLLALHAPPAVSAAVKEHLRSSLLLESMGESKRLERIRAFAGAAQQDGLALAQLLVARARAGLGYVFAHGTPADITQALSVVAQRGGGTALDLRTAELAVLPEEIAEMRDVVDIDLGSNHFSAFPPPLLKMPWLKRLRLSGNGIARFPASLAPLSLEVLELASNRIETFPSAVLAQTELVELDLSNTQEYVEHEARITGMPEAIGGLTKLVRLRYRRALLGDGFPASLFTLAHLEELDLFGSTLPAVTDVGLARLPALKRLDLRHSSWWDRRSELRELLPGVEIQFD